MKKIRLFDAASQDLESGFNFYEKQERGLGGYVNPNISKYIIGCYQGDFLSLSTIVLMVMISSCTRFWIAEKTSLDAKAFELTLQGLAPQVPVLFNLKDKYKV